MMRNYLLNNMQEFHSNSELHVMAIMLVHFAIYMTENFPLKKIIPNLSVYIPLEIYLNSLNLLCHKLGILTF